MGTHVKESLIRRTGRFIFGKLLPRRPYPVTTGPLRGASFVLGSLSGEGGGATVYFNSVEPEQTAAFVREMHPGYTLFDIGANVGYYTILGSRLAGAAGRVVAFEPATRNLALLQRHVELNKASNVRILPFAVSDANGISLFDDSIDGAMGKLDASGKTIVPTITLDEAADRLGYIPDVMKIDVEGAEMAVLRGAANVLRSRPKIFLSTHSGELRTECLDHLRGSGYSFAPLVETDDPHEFFLWI